MSRVYSALTGALRPAGAALLDAPDDGVWENSEEPVAESPISPIAAPFIEIGGPGGPVFSPSLGAPPAKPPVAAPRSEVKPQPQPKVDEPTRTFPRLAPPAATAHLSVRFHDVVALGTKGQGPDASLVTFHLPDHPVSGEYRTLKGAIQNQLPQTPSRILLFTAAAAESGTTTVLLNLAVTLAGEATTRVLVVDGNVKRAALAAKLGLQAAPGLCEVLGNRVPLTLAVQPTAVKRLDALSAGLGADAIAVALGREFPRLLGQLRHWYDWVIVDGGIWGTIPERDATCPSVDAVYLVTREGLAERPEFAAARGWVKELGGPLRGYVTTRV
jgi:Mrp family chromosome partitioning ATPase